MLPIEDVRRIDFWADTPPEQMFEKYRNGLDGYVTRVFPSSRPRSFVHIKEGVPSLSSSDSAA